MNLKTKLLFAFVLLILPTSVFAKGMEKPAVAVTIGNDFYSAGGLVEMKGVAEDDAYLTGAIVNVNQKVTNDLIAFGSNLNITSDIGDDLRAGGSLVNLFGKVAGDAILAGGVVNISNEAKIDGDASVWGGLLNFNGDVGGDLELGGDEINFNGTVDGDVKIRPGKKINFGENAKIGGKLTYSSRDEIVIPEGIASEVIHEDYKTDKATYKDGLKEFIGGMRLETKIFTFVISFIGGLVLLACMGKSSSAFATTLRENFWWSLFAGVLFFLVPIVALLLFASAVGIWLGAIALLCFLLSLLVSGALMGFALGSFILKAKKEDKYSRKMLTLLLGCVILFALNFIPAFGGALKLVVFVITLGGLVLTKFALYKQAKKAKLL